MRRYSPTVNQIASRSRFGDGRTGRDSFNKGAITTLQFWVGHTDLLVVWRLRSRRRIFQGRRQRARSAVLRAGNRCRPVNLNGETGATDTAKCSCPHRQTSAPSASRCQRARSILRAPLIGPSTVDGMPHSHPTRDDACTNQTDPVVRTDHHQRGMALRQVTDPQGNSRIPRDTVVRHVPLTSLSSMVQRAGPPDAPNPVKAHNRSPST
jgi:hypothetical protein